MMRKFQRSVEIGSKNLVGDFKVVQEQENFLFFDKDEM